MHLQGPVCMALVAADQEHVHPRTTYLTVVSSAKPAFDEVEQDALAGPKRRWNRERWNTQETS
jgi:hypothetical protein